MNIRRLHLHKVQINFIQGFTLTHSEHKFNDEIDTYDKNDIKCKS
jgi:hypothetical protein